MPGSLPKARCQCYDAHDGHPHDGAVLEDRFADGAPRPKHPRCTNRERLVTLFRVDMEDRTGTAFCAHCAKDALESGLFRGARD